MAILISQGKNGGRLWQGGLSDLAHHELYDVIVLCADELQPDGETSKAYGHVRLIPAPNDDSGTPLTLEQAKIAVQAAIEIEKEYKAGRRVLISCAQGRNRSGLVMALVLHRLLGISGEFAIRFIRQRVPNALTNDSFNKFLRTVGRAP